ncbi:MerR family transcriptional regulator [Sedimentibacter sp. zth1]|uniref:MerR family transcriptional regulator n=1 Tax=Sedimentibacter sp. zth1 TaxID=2816908 RepID=UPI001A91439B|nr:MerR family transcriptional regulator [Sedimentibacter sp. zth1]QSX06757.1 MerR family transcriptional regulator [Sedimentibacter sp. zth1]
MKVSEFSSKCCISIDTVRYYEKLGLIHPMKLKNGIKSYDNDDLEKVKIIIMLKKLNLSLSDIKKLFNLDEIYDNVGNDTDKKICIMKSAESMLKKAYNELLVTENQLVIAKNLLEKSINKIDKSLEHVTDLP